MPICERSYERLAYLLIIPFLLIASCAASSSAQRQAAISAFGSDGSGIGDDFLVDRGGSGVNAAEDIEAMIQKSVIVVDAGHGGDDYGTCSKKVNEKDINLDISLKLGQLLEQAGIRVVYTRKTDEFIPLRTRADIANEIGATLFISIHNNGLDGNDSSYKGSETLYFSKDESEDAPLNSQKLAQIVQKHLVQELDTDDNGIISRPKLAVLRLTNMPAIIAEVGYISNPSDRAKLVSPEMRQKAAKGLYDAVIEALRELYSTKTGNDK